MRTLKIKYALTASWLVVAALSLQAMPAHVKAEQRAPAGDASKATKSANPAAATESFEADVPPPNWSVAEGAAPLVWCGGARNSTDRSAWGRLTLVP